MIFTGKVVLVTGSANGIGKAIAGEFLAQGATVIIADIDEKNGEALAAEWSNHGYRAVFHGIDLREATSIPSMFQRIVSDYGKIDILINNAGRGMFKPVCDLSLEEWDEILALNLRAAFVAAREFACHHRSSAYGRIINIASTRAIMSEPGSEAYAASKGGLVALTHALALSLGSAGITVNAISPGWIANSGHDRLSEADHRQHPSQRVGKPEDIARLCTFIAAPENDFITGQNFVVDGGMTKKMIYVE